MYIQTKALIDEYESRLVLFSCIEPGHIAWSQEIMRNGATAVLNGILDGDYEERAYEKLRKRILHTNSDMLISAINASESEFIYPGHSKWPHQLNQLTNPPIGLIVKGDVSCLTRKSIAIVGTREPSEYGKRTAREFAEAFVNEGWLIVSGGATGIDSHAHSAALRASGQSIAVIASGISVDYPSSNSNLFEAISNSGALVSEVMPFIRAQQNRFLIRNRIIAALSCATLVVEAAYRSGSLRTARDASDLMRPVMAVPGPLNSTTSEGCHRLIAERAAEIVTSVADAVEFVGIN